MLAVSLSLFCVWNLEITFEPRLDPQGITEAMQGFAEWMGRSYRRNIKDLYTWNKEIFL